MSTEWIETELQKLDLEGRDALHTHLIIQEIPMWLATVREGRDIPEAEVSWLIQRRGFNRDEAQKVRTLAAWIRDHQEAIRDHEFREISRLG